MVKTLATRSAVGVLATLVAATGVLVPAQAAPPVSVDKAGTLVGWGAESSAPAARTLPDELNGTAFRKVVASGGFSVTLTSAGKVVVLGESTYPGANIQDVPDSIKSATVTDIAVASNALWAAAVTSEGKVVVWGAQFETADPTDMPDGLAGVKAVAISQSTAAAVKTDGTVVAWGRDQGGETAVPEGLTGVTSLAAGDLHYYALKNDGTVVAWGFNGNNQITLPAALSVPGNVKAIEARGRGGLALLNDGSLLSWGLFTDPGVDNAVPASLDGKKVVTIASSGNNNVAVADDGTIAVWGLGFGPGSGMEGLVETPDALVDADVAAVTIGGDHAIALVTKVLEVTRATVTGTATVAQTLTGTPASFSGGPDAVTSQWLADGVAIAGATGTNLVLNSSHVGKRITFATTATKTGEEPFVSTSAQTGPVVAPQAQQPTPQPPAVGPVKSKPTFKANKVPTSKKKGKATVAVPAAAGRAKATGKATITIKTGKTTKKIKVRLSGGKKSITLPKLKKGTWKVQVSYNGDKNYLAQKSKSYKLKIKR